VELDVCGDEGAYTYPLEFRLAICESTVLMGKESSASGCRIEDSDRRIIVDDLSNSFGSCLMPFLRAPISRMRREVAFFMRRQREMCSSTTLTLCHSCRVFVLALLSSSSRFVRRQSSMASLMAVMVRITMIGTEPRPGFVAPKMGNI
jgi:hypothetical protein